MTESGLQLNSVCSICHETIVNEDKDHKPAYHVVRAYHYAQDGSCVIDKEEWPCGWWEKMKNKQL